MNLQSLENELWEAADQLRANSKLTAANTPCRCWA
jgi:type I restriction enzyme M protein